MLKLGPLQKQIKKMFGEKISNRDEFLEKIILGIREIKNWEKKLEELRTRVDMAKTSWLVAKIVEPLDIKLKVPERPASVSVIATDGSQIFPDHHGILSCYLINIGEIILHYGTRERPHMESKPYLFYREEDLYEDFGGRKVSVNTSIVSARRTLMEMERLTELLLENGERENIVGLLDGTLILWTLEGTPPDFRNKILFKFLDQIVKLKEKKISLTSYISRPRSSDVINTLRLGLCPENPVNCDKCPYKNDLFIPCSPLEGITDASLFGKILKEGERSPLFESSSNILSHYGENKVQFFYINTGREIGRIEIPAWINREKNKLDLIHSVIYDQIKKGGGYPVALSEAHEKAVIKGDERQIFYKLISDELIHEKIPLTMSAKKASKERVRI